jgi:hypothetical protein
MANIDFRAERNALDYFTQSMWSSDFLKKVTDILEKGLGDSVTLGELHRKWLEESLIVRSPFSSGTIVGFLYVGLLMAKEIWIDHVPDFPGHESNDDWPFSDIEVTASKVPRPSSRYILRRLRNALAHGMVEVNPPDPFPMGEVDNVIVKFHDENPRDITDSFDAETKMITLIVLIKSFQDTVYQDMLSKIDSKEIEELNARRINPWRTSPPGQ